MAEELHYQIVLGDKDAQPLLRAVEYLHENRMSFNVTTGIGYTPEWGIEDTITLSFWLAMTPEHGYARNLAKVLAIECNQEAVGLILPDGRVEVVYA